MTDDESIRRCPRCGAPPYGSDAASKQSGAGGVLEWDDDLCPTCEDWDRRRRRDYRVKARPYLLARAMRPTTETDADAETTLEAYQ